MITENEDIIKIEDVEDTKEMWSRKPYISNDLQKSIVDSDILILPAEKIRDRDILNFPPLTQDMEFYFKENLPEEIKIEVCVEDEDFQIIQLNDITLELGHFLVMSIALPLFLKVLYDYCKYKLVGGKSKVKFSMIEERINGRSRKIDYNGDVEGLKEIMDYLKKR